MVNLGLWGAPTVAVSTIEFIFSSTCQQINGLYVLKNSHRLGLNALICLWGLVVAAPALGCGSMQLSQLIVAAQSLDLATVAKGESLLACPDQADAAAQWIAFAYSATGDSNRAQSVSPQARLRTRGSAERSALLARARQGQYQALLSKVEHGESGYVNAADAQLILARALIRRGQFRRGQEAYIDYLRLNSRDEAAEAEYLYSFIWAKEYERADELLAQTARYPMSASLTNAVARGRALIAQRRAPLSAPSSPSSSLESNQGRMEIAAESYAIGRSFARRSVHASYQGLLTLKASAHALDLQVFGPMQEGGSEAFVGGHWQLFGYPDRGTASSQTSVVEISGGVGVYSADVAAKPFGEAQLAFESGGRKWGIRGGGARTPLAPQLALTPADQIAMQDHLFLSAHYGRFASVHLEAGNEVVDHTIYAAHSIYKLLLRGPVFRGEQGSYIELRLPLAYEDYPSPSPLYVADRETASFGLGLEAFFHFAELLSLDLLADYCWEVAKTRGNNPQTERHPLLTVHAGLSVGLSDMWSMRLESVYHLTDSEQRREERRLSRGIMLGVAYGQ